MLSPVAIYRPGETEASEPPADLAAYLVSLKQAGAAITEVGDLEVDGHPATRMTVGLAPGTEPGSLDGAIGCPEPGEAAADCFGPQDDLVLRPARPTTRASTRWCPASTSAEDGPGPLWQSRSVRHRYECPMRWADLDQLGHVNNVVYVDYLQEARVDMLRAHGRGPEALAEGLVVARHEVTYLKPLTFDFRPVSIECWVTEIRAATFTMAYEVFRDEPDGERVVHLRATTVLTPYVFAEERPRRITVEERTALERHLEPDAQGRRRTPALPEAETHHYPVHVRFSDVDVYGHVNNVKYFEYLQEARIALINEQVPFRAFHLVVAQTDVDYLRALQFRAEPYDCRSAVTRVGTRSMTIESEFRDGDLVLARALVVVVFFDLADNRSTEPTAEVRTALERISVAR